MEPDALLLLTPYAVPEMTPVLVSLESWLVFETPVAPPVMRPEAL